MKKSRILNQNISAVLGATALVCAISTASSVHADDTYVSTATITIPSSCSITSTLDTPHTATIPAGIYSGNYNSDGNDYTNGIGRTTIKAFCNDSGGFSIYAIGYTNDTYGNTNLVGPDDNNIATGTAVSGNTSNWAMKIGAVTGTYTPTIAGTYGSYTAVPTTYDKVASFGAVTDLTNGSSITTTYAAYIASNQQPGTYNGKVKYTLVHPASETPLQPQTTDPGKICYYANANTYEGTMGCQNVSSSVTLLASNFSRDGYGFAGWTNKFDYATNPNQEGIKFYGPQETITLTPADYRSPNNGLSLYAIWIKSAGNLQDTAKVTELCGTGTNALVTAPTDGTANLDSVSALTDQRDDQTYAIAKLADGKCWMIENLRLESTNSDNSTGNLAQGYGTSTTYGNFSGLADAESANFTDSTTANSLYYSGTQEGTASIDIGASNYPAYRMPRYNNANTSARASTPTANGSAMFGYGNYYSWPAAIANTGHYPSNNQSATQTSICPAGWRLPRGGDKNNETNNDYWSLIVDGLNNGTKPANYDSANPYYVGTEEASALANTIKSYPNNYLFAGYYHSSSLSSRGIYGVYSTATSLGSSFNAYKLILSSQSIYPGNTQWTGTNYNGKTTGSSIRCLASSNN